MTTSIEGRIAEELGVRERQVKAAVELLDGGSTVPFIARYRKEATEMLDDAQLRTLEERLRYLRELEDRRTARRPRLTLRCSPGGSRWPTSRARATSALQSRCAGPFS
ncbi:Tex-like N-terminal domain-containing protein, partial [Streptomyces sp. NPDC059835]|uniref:Tex-like N-terminal domain-containing protein n=1 Tax=Streptomyces sp. NPDC059835 TaxID=3346967 RepID=UPI003666E210